MPLNTYSQLLYLCFDNSTFTYLSKYESIINTRVLSTYDKKPNKTIDIVWDIAPVINRCLRPILVPNFTNMGPARKAAKFSQPNTKPY